MLSNEYFYFSLMRKYVAAFGSLFNNLIIERTNKAGIITQIINVPIQYAEKETMLSRMKEDPSIENPTAIVLPRISFFLDGYNYDSDRKSSGNGKFIIGNKPNITWQYKEVPWNFNFRVWIYVKNIIDASKMLEQILPFFSPAYTARLLLIDNRPPTDILIELRNVSHLDTQSENLKQRTVEIWELAFTMKGYLYGPIHTNPPIKVVNLEFYDADDFPQGNTIINQNFGISDTLINTANNGQYWFDFMTSEQPGLTGNGQPTSNASASIPYSQINFDDDWGIIDAINQLDSSN